LELYWFFLSYFCYFGSFSMNSAVRRSCKLQGFLTLLCVAF
jgi:hypothetical protein